MPSPARPRPGAQSARRPRWRFHSTADRVKGDAMRRTTRTTRLHLEALEDRCTPSYAVVDLGALNPSAINNAGVIAGAANGDAALWQNGTITDLGASGQANDLNDTGQVVGKGASEAFLWASS